MFGLGKKASKPAASVAAAPTMKRVAPVRKGPPGSSHSAEGPESVPVAGELKKFGGVVMADVPPIEFQADLLKVLFHEIINKEAKLAQHLYSCIAIARLQAAPMNDIILFVDINRCSKDDLATVVEHLRKNGFKLPATGVQGYAVVGSLVMSLSQGHMNPNVIRSARAIARDPGKSALMNSFTDIVAWAVDQNAADIDWVVDQHHSVSQMAFKIDGRYVRPKRFEIPTDTLIQMLSIAFQKSGGAADATFEVASEQQCNIELALPRTLKNPNGKRVRLRWSSMANDKGTVVTTRIQLLGESAMIRSLDGAGYLQSQMDIFDRVRNSEGGMTIFSGVVGSGKSTSLAQLIGMLPHDVKIISFEDPVELEIARVYQKTIVRDMLSNDNTAFLSATRALFRSALDVMYLGEIRDNETGKVARTIVESGHSVYTTIHARSALGSIDRLASPAIGVPRDVLSTPGIMKLMVYQALLPTNCPFCSKSPDEYAKAYGLRGRDLEAHNQYFERLWRLYGVAPNQYRMRDPQGCQHCKNEELPELNGFKGRTVVSEMIEPDEQMLEYIAETKNLELERYWKSTASPRYDDPDLTGKTTMECAVYKAVAGAKDNQGKSYGTIDPRQIEPRFDSFETIETRRERSKKVAAHKAQRDKSAQLSTVFTPAHAPLELAEDHVGHVGHVGHVEKSRAEPVLEAVTLQPRAQAAAAAVQAPVAAPAPHVAVAAPASAQARPIAPARPAIAVVPPAPAPAMPPRSPLPGVLASGLVSDEVSLEGVLRE